MSSPRKPFEPEVLVNGRHASSRTFLIAALFGAAIAIAAGCGGGGGSSTAPSGGSGPVATASPSPGASPVTQSLSVGQALAPSATFSPLPLTGVGSTTITIGLTSASASATVIATAQGAQPSGVAVPSAMARRPASIGGSIVSLAFISVATTSGSTTLQKSPSFSASFTNALSGSNIYLAQYTNGTWSTIAIGALSSGNKVATFLPFTEPITYGTAATWFVIFTDSLSLPSPTPAPNPTGVPTGAPTTAPTIGPTAAPLPDALQFNVPGLYGEIIANGLPAPRQLVALPNGDLLVGTDDKSGTVWIVPHADGPAGAGTPKIFTTVPSPSTQEPAQGLAFDGSNVYIATNQSVWQVPYKTGDQSEPTPTVEIAKVRRGPIAPMSDGDVHFTSSVAVVSATTPKMLYVGVGSSCNACVEVDPTRGTIQSVNLSAGQLSQTLAASRFRNALALAVNPATNTLWAGRCRTRRSAAARRFGRHRRQQPVRRPSVRVLRPRHDAQRHPRLRVAGVRGKQPSVQPAQCTGRHLQGGGTGDGGVGDQRRSAGRRTVRLLDDHRSRVLSGQPDRRERLPRQRPPRRPRRRVLVDARFVA
jgi:hypothetical protein